MKLYWPAAALVVALVVLAPLAEWILPDLLPSEPAVSYPVMLDPPRTGEPSWAVASRARWSTILQDALDAGLLPGFSSPLMAQPGGTRFYAQVIEVAKAGARFTTICGAACATATATCAAGSAYAAADALTNDPNNPALIHVNAGRYDECVHFDNISDIALDLGQAVVWPTVVNTTDVQNGVIRFGATTTTRNSTARIEVTGGTVKNYAWSAPEACVQIGKDAGPGAGNLAPFNDIYVHDMEVFCNHDGMQVFGSRLATEDDPPRATFARNRVVAGADGLAFKGFGKFKAIGNDIYSSPNFSESTNVDFLAVRGAPTVAAGAGSTTTLVIAAADDPGTDRFYVGRKVTLTDADGGGAGTCGATNACANLQVWGLNFVTATDTLTFMPPCTEATTTGCAYQIAAVTHDNGEAYVAGDVVDAMLTDVDLSTMRGTAASGSAAYWKNTCKHVSTTQGAPVPDGDSLELIDNTCTITMNDFGPDPNGGVGCTGQEHVTPFLAPLNQHQDLVIDGLASIVNINVDLPDGNGCVNPIAGMSFTGTVTYEGAVSISNVHTTINNRGDPDEEVVGLNAKSTGTAFTANVANAYVDINNTVAGYAGTSVTVAQANNTTIKIGNLTSPDPITTSGTIGHLAEMGAGLSGSASLDFNFAGGADQGTCQAAQTITVTGAVVNDVVRYNIPNASIIAGIAWNVWVSAADTVSVQPCCTTAADCADTPAGTWNVRVEKP